MHCSWTFMLVYISLLLTTAGFVLTLSSWFAPPINRFVHTVRIVGPCALVSGFALLLTSCLACALDQGRCCRCCYRLLGNRIKFKFMRSLRSDPRQENYQAKTHRLRYKEWHDIAAKSSRNKSDDVITCEKTKATSIKTKIKDSNLKKF